MFSQGKKFVAVEKRGGKRCAIKRNQNEDKILSADEYFKDKKNNSLFPKRLGEYKFLFFTNFDESDLTMFILLASWIKVNEQFFDSRNNFPIYGFVVGEKNKSIKMQRIKEFMSRLAEYFGWNDPNHHLYNGYNNSLSRIWYDSDSTEGYTNELELLENKSDLPEPLPFKDFVNDLMNVKQSNLLLFYLKPLEFYKELSETQLNYFLNVKSVFYKNNSDYEFFNNLQTDSNFFCSDLNKDVILSPSLCTKMFNELEKSEDDEIANLLNKVMYFFNDNILNSNIDIVKECNLFENVDFNDFDLITNTRSKLSEQDLKKYSLNLDIIESLVQNYSRQLSGDSCLAFITILIGTGTFKNNCLKLENGNLKGNGITFLKSVKKLIEGMLLKAFELL